MRSPWVLSLFFLSGVAANQAAVESCPPVPANFTLSPPQPRGSRELPDPFRTVRGERITKKSEWECRRSEIAELAQRHELGPIPGPPTVLSATVVNDTQLVVEITEDNNTISFTANITFPTVGYPPYPVLIGINGINFPTPPTVAKVIFPMDQLAQPAETFVRPREGLFYTLYGRDHPAGLTAAGAWATSRVIDAIELMAEATGLDPGRVGVTGCLRNGRTALAAGGFDERVALTVAREAGAGGSSCYRLRVDDRPAPGGIDVCNTLQCPPYPDGGQTAAFAHFYDNPHELPFDRHGVAALVAPRPLLVLQSDVNWLEPKSSFQCMGAAKKVYDALGVPDRMAVSVMGGLSVCQLSHRQEALLDAYLRKFLLREEDVDFDTDVIEKDVDWEPLPAYNWTVPILE
ncbi:hypothetical protein VTH82DRAFT_587 [Thermothelomyces myriococcoides]